MFLNEHLTDRQPLNLYQWIDQAPPEAWLAAEMIEEVPQIALQKEPISIEDTPGAKQLGSREPSSTSEQPDR